MNPSPFLTVFPRQLRYWTLHCSLNALPSFCIALAFLGFWKTPSAVAAMCCAITTFILLYAALTSMNGPFSDENHILPRALKLGAKIRGWISGLSLLVVFTPAVSATPDFWCGFISVSCTNFLLKSPGDSFDLASGFLPVYITTMFEGMILSFILLMISFFAVIFLQSHERRKFFTAGKSL